MVDDDVLATLRARAQRPGGFPVIMFTRKGKPLWLVMKVSDRAKAYAWLHIGHPRAYHRFVQNPWPHWQAPKSWLDDLARRLVARFGGCYIIQALREKETCAPACWNAEGIECECSCMGVRHGAGHPGGRWYEVSETFAFSYGDQELHYKLLKAARAK